MARSTDGVHWKKLPAEFAGSAAWDSKVLCDATVLVEGSGGPRLVRRGRRRLARREPAWPRSGRAGWYTDNWMNVASPAIPPTAASGIVATNRPGTRHPWPRGAFITLRQPHPAGWRHTADSLTTKVEVSNYPCFQYPPTAGPGLAHVRSGGILRLDVLHVHMPFPLHLRHAGQQNAAPTRRLPFITTLHGTDITLVGADRSYFPITKFSMEHSNGITAVSDSCAARPSSVRITNGNPRHHDFVNWRAIPSDNVKRARPTTRRRARSCSCNLSNFRPVKRVMDCVRILAESAQEVPAHLLMAGDGPDRGPSRTPGRGVARGQARHVSGEAGPPWSG